MKFEIKKTIKINGKQYNDLSEVPEALREAYQKAKSAADAAAGSINPATFQSSSSNLTASTSGAEGVSKTRLAITLIVLASVALFFWLRHV